LSNVDHLVEFILIIVV